MEQRLADTEAMRKIEGRFLNLFSRTFLKGAVGRPGPQIQSSVKTQFSSQTYQAQVDKIIDDIYIESVDYVDNKIEALDLGTGKKGGSAQAARLLSKPSPGQRRAAAKKKPLPITEEAVKASKELSAEVSESIIRILKEEAIYEIHPNQLANRIKDLWGGSKYKATRFTRTFTADVSQNTAVHRYADMGIPELQFYAEIDDKTTDQCKTFHGTIIRTDSNDIGKFRPPLHHHCLIQGTKIETSFGEKNIEDIRIGDHVLTHLENYQPVTHTMLRYADNIIEISTGKRTIKITENHPVLTKRDNIFLWVLAGDLQENDEIAIVY
jgi:SPP1 gp7 family putative phage head morphogenesis protein